MEEKKQKILIVLGIVFLILVLAGIIYFLYFHDLSAPRDRGEEPGQQEEQDTLPGSGERDGEDEEPSQDEEGGVSQDVGTSSQDYNFRDKEELEENDFKKMASSFVERFGSYSSHSGFDNIKDLRSLMSEDMEEWANGYIEERVEEESEKSDYYGVSTFATITKVEEVDKSEGRVVVRVNTQRNEVRDNKEESFSQPIEITLIQENEEWKVDRAEWK